MYKKVYLEITNNCNLNCSFCHKNNRTKKFMSKDEFKIILKKLEGYTNYLYFHVMGEPLLHPYINEFIDYATEQNFFVNITTNGYLIKRVVNNENIRQINISLHSYDENYHISLEEYLHNVVETCDKLSKHTFVAYRFWLNSKYTEEIVNYLNNYYNKKIELVNNFKIKENIFISINEEFIWPDFANNYYSEKGKCYALKDHLGILVNGDVVPCCLDSDGIIKLGNIFSEEISDVIKSERYQNMLKGFQKNYKCEELCRKCNFLK